MDDFARSMITVSEALTMATGALASALKHRDLHTQMHSERVIHIAMQLGQACALSAREMLQLECGARMHDIGKIGIDDEILLKPGALNDEERSQMQTHASIGAEIIEALNYQDCDGVATAVRHHHEDWNGFGYPDRLAGESIPVLARIIALADCYDARTETRSYHQPLSHEQALAWVCSMEQEKFDPYLVKHFVSLCDNPEFVRQIASAQ